MTMLLLVENWDVMGSRNYRALKESKDNKIIGPAVWRIYGPTIIYYKIMFLLMIIVFKMS